MITLTPDKFILVKMGFSIRDMVNQGPGRSTPRHIARPEGFATPRKVVYGHVGLHRVMGWDNAYQRALYPGLSVTVHRLVQVTA
jgi:hypothetical protein